MLSEELRNLSIWLRARRQPVDVRVVVGMLDELAEEAERLEANTRLTGEEAAEVVAREGIR